MRSLDPDYFKRLEQFIDDYMDEYARSPSTREIAAGTGHSVSTVHKYLSKMRADGILDYSGHRNITTRRRRKMSEQSVQVPVLGKVSCGALKFAEECIEEYVHLPVALFGQGKYFLLRANGESMIEAGIDDGTLVLVRQQDFIEDGRIDAFIADRYSSYNSGIGAKIRAGETSLEELAAYAESMGAPALPGSGRQEYLESIVNNILFCG